MSSSRSGTGRSDEVLHINSRTLISASALPPAGPAALRSPLAQPLEFVRIVEEAGDIVASIRAKPETPRCCTTAEKTLLDIRKRIESHIRNSYLKRVDAPVGVKPRLRCWMELNEG